MTAGSEQALHLHLFLSSPGDVTDERTLAKEVIERIQSERAHRERLRLEIVAWDKPGAGTAMPAHLEPQEALERGLRNPSACEIVIVIFGYRMGTPLSEKHLKPNGERYWSGTEYEFLDALNAARQQGIPDVLVYRKQGAPNVNLDDPEIKEKQAQWQRVKDFFAAFRNPDGSFGSYYKTYEKPSHFKEMLDEDLRDIVARYLEKQTPSVDIPPSIEEPIEEPVWHESPYPGLRAFRTDEAPIFFGRDRETDELVEKLSDPRNRLIVVVGASGSGKSSLVAAGLLPRLQKNAIPGSQDWILDMRFTPGEVGDNALVALATKLTPKLEKQNKPPRELADELATNPEKFGELVGLLLKDRPDWAELLLFIDQFEELFTLVHSDRQGPFIKLLAAVVKMPRVRIVATLRADFFEANVQWPELAELLRDATFPLAAPVALDEMITGPAKRAGLTFEKGLVERIRQDTGAEPGALALMACALAELYDRRSDGTLTQAAYENFDGVHGVIRKRAGETYEKLDDGAKASFDRVFNALVEVDPASGTPTRKRARRSDFETAPAALKFIDAFTQARLLVCSEDVVEVAHEKLFTAWKVLSDWIEAHREQLKAGQDLEEAAQEWQAIGKPWSGLASGARLKRYRQAISPSALADKFLRASQRRLWIQRGLAGFATSLALAVLVGAVWLYANGLTMKHGTSVLLAAVGLYHFDEPEMVEIPVGEFWMGSGDDDKEASGGEKPRHKVTITKPFAIGKYEVTFDEYNQFAYATGRPLPSDYTIGQVQEWGRRPVVNVSWLDAVAYAEWLSRMTGKPYRLPTEAEWEYAARGGSKSSRFWGDDPNQACQYANVADKSFRQAGFSGEIFDCDDGQPIAAEVGSFKANRFGLYDMLGNVWEWVRDAWHDNYEGAPVDGSVWEGEQGGPRVVRGGSWGSGPRGVRGAARGRYGPRVRLNALGFRLART
ncbi:MAG: SUMF1/EgtB/PvdO family nonheme iron enzyme [Candidatus Competibacteraceae bacterium]